MNRRVFDLLRRHLAELEGTEESVAWYGDCWHWCLEYRVRRGKEPVAVVVPCPQDLQLAFPIDREFARTLPLKRMKRAVRDGLDLAAEPFDTRWGVWSVSGAGLIEDLCNLIELKLSHQARRVG